MSPPRDADLPATRVGEQPEPRRQSPPRFQPHVCDYEPGPTPTGAGSGDSVCCWSRAAKYSAPSMLIWGTTRSSHLGMYQLWLPIISIRAGTSKHLTTVASRITATASPTPNCLIVGSPLRRKLPNTNTMIRAAAVITRALVTRPEM